MSDSRPLFDWQPMPRYPGTAGFKSVGPSSEAAAIITQTITDRQARVLNLLKMHGPMTADECAAKDGRTVLAVRPRLSELYKLGLIERTGERRRNDSGLNAWVYRSK